MYGGAKVSMIMGRAWNRRKKKKKKKRPEISPRKNGGAKVGMWLGLV